MKNRIVNILGTKYTIEFKDVNQDDFELLLKN